MSNEINQNETASNAHQLELNKSKITIEINGVRVGGQKDLEQLLSSLCPAISSEMFQAKNSQKKEWSVTGTVTTTQGGTTATGSGTYTSRNWTASVSGSTPIGGGVSGTVTATTGSQGTSGTVGISGTF